MSPQRRTALVSVGAAVALMGIKLGTGLASGSLGLVSEALHSGTDLVAALLTFFAIGVAGQPADRSHPYGHGKAEHLAALAEAVVLLLVSVAVGALAVARIAGWIEIETSTAWWVFAAVGGRDHDRRLAHARLAPGGAPVRRARRSPRTRSTSGAISSARSPCSRACSPSRPVGRRATRSPRCSSRSSSSRPPAG